MKKLQVRCGKVQNEILTDGQLTDGQYICVEGKDGIGTVSIGEMYKGFLCVEHIFPARLGKSGMGKVREGDNKTPFGIYAIGDAYGIKENPGCVLPFHRIEEDMYWCEEAGMFYNRLVRRKQASQLWTSTGRVDSEGRIGEHLIDYVPEYNYFLDIGYNREQKPGAGSAIFLHCFGKNDATKGCIAVAEEDMITLLRWVQPGTKIWIREL